mmetsp:Transcript_117877/g.328349  ORF Transcript_117877/g.328349 Transcript_117877/m.328349 type:complete len:380 (+) Transcript_117877:243-1382(+)
MATPTQCQRQLHHLLWHCTPFARLLAKYRLVAGTPCQVLRRAEPAQIQGCWLWQPHMSLDQLLQVEGREVVRSALLCHQLVRPEEGTQGPGLPQGQRLRPEFTEEGGIVVLLLVQSPCGQAPLADDEGHAAEALQEDRVAAASLAGVHLVRPRRAVRRVVVTVGVVQVPVVDHVEPNVRGALADDLPKPLPRVLQDVGIDEAQIDGIAVRREDLSNLGNHLQVEVPDHRGGLWTLVHHQGLVHELDAPYAVRPARHVLHALDVAGKLQHGRLAPGVVVGVVEEEGLGPPPARERLVGRLRTGEPVEVQNGPHPSLLEPVEHGLEVPLAAVHEAVRRVVIDEPEAHGDPHMGDAKVVQEIKVLWGDKVFPMSVHEVDGFR